ncbi:MAG: TonB-dependent receptor, partial [Acidobacteriota bacterium]
LDTHTTLEARAIETGGEPGHNLSALVDWSPTDRQAGLSILGQLDRVDPSDLDGDGFTEVTRRDLETFALRGELYTDGGDTRWHGEANWTDARRRGGDLVRIDLAPEETALTEAIDTRRLGLAVGWLHTVSSKLDVRATASYADTDRDSYYGADFDPNAYGTTENPLWLIDTQVNLYRQRGTITGGLQYSRDAIDDRQPGYGRSLTETITNLGAYVQDDRQFGDRITAVYGVRVDDHSALDNPVVSPRLAVLAAPRDDVTLRLSIARGFRAPTIFDEDLHIELAGGDARVVRPADELIEERSLAWLASAEWRPTFGRRGSASITLAAFRTDLDDLFQQIEADDPATDEREFLRVNADGARVEGVEATASVRWGTGLLIEAGYVVQRARFDVPEPDFGSRDFFRTPERYGTLSLQARLPAAIDLFVGVRHTGPMTAPHYAGFIAEDRLERTPSFVELDVSLSRRFSIGEERDVTLTLGAKNLTDAYQEDLDQGSARDSNYVYGPRLPRTVHLGLRWEL